jgi:hypothetical protein
MTLVEFLQARLTEDELIALAAVDSSPQWRASYDYRDVKDEHGHYVIQADARHPSVEQADCERSRDSPINGQLSTITRLTNKPSRGVGHPQLHFETLCDRVSACTGRISLGMSLICRPRSKRAISRRDRGRARCDTT